MVSCLTSKLFTRLYFINKYVNTRAIIGKCDLILFLPTISNTFRLFSALLPHQRSYNMSSPGNNRRRILCLFDVDGTLTKPRNAIEAHFEEFVYNKIKPLCTIGIVGGSDLKKIAEQMNGFSVLEKFDYVFPENGLIQYKNGIEVGRQSIASLIGEDQLQRFINYTLGYLSQITLPVKRGTFVEFRSGMLNISPIGRSCSQQERDDFEKYDKVHGIRKAMIETLKSKFPDIGFTYSIGGQISFDVFPNGWDKTFCLDFLQQECFEEIHFFGDKTDTGGNDYEIFHDTRTIGHKVLNPNDTKMQLIELLGV